MSIADKLTRIAENEQRVYDAGKIALLKDSKYMSGTASGELVSLKDVSPVEHTVGVKTSAAKIQVLGKNWLDCGTVDISVNGRLFDNMGNPIPAGTYTLSANITSTDVDSTQCMVTYWSDNVNYVAKPIGRGNRASMAFTTDKPITRIQVYAGYGNGQSLGDTATFADCQLESGTVATSYEPYKPLVEYAQGEAVKSIHPTMNIMTDTEGASVDVEYLRDIDAYIDNLTGASTVMTLDE